MIQKPVDKTDWYVVKCPGCTKGAFVYIGSVGIGKKLLLSNIIGGTWAEATIPCCFHCKYHFGPNDFKENYFIDYSKYFSSCQDLKLESSVKEDFDRKFATSSNDQFDFFDKKMVEEQEVPYKRLWDYFRQSLKDQTP